MSLRFKVVLVMAVAVVLMAALNAAVLLPVSQSFTELEEEEARRNSDRVQRAISSELRHMARNALDWANWDDAYEFVDGRRPEFVEDNLYPETLKNLQVHLMYIYDRAGRIAWGAAYDLETGAPLAIPQFAPGALRPDNPLLVNTAPETVTTGIMLTDAGPMLVVASPIVPSEKVAPAKGTFVFGRLLDAALIDRIGQQVNVEFEVTAALGRHEPAAAADGWLSLEKVGPDLILGHAIMTDIYGLPAVHLDSRTPRDISHVGHRSIGISLASLVLIGLLDLLVMWVMLRRLVLGPVSRITESVLEIGRAGTLDRRVPALGDDELGVLAREFNRMLDRLSEANKQLVEQSHRTGMAEMASGVLHNLRNGLSPLMGRLETVSERLRDAPGGELRRAAEEVANPGTDAARRDRLLDYVASTGDSLAALKAAALGEIDKAKSLAERLGEILRHQEKFIYSTGAVRPLSLGEVMRDVLDLLPAQLAGGTVVEIDEAIGALPPVAADRVTLMQVFQNLLLNAMDAIQAAGRASGRVSVTARQPEGAGAIEIVVRDNGAGIDPDNLPRLFDRGFTTKIGRAGGLGLHWCANTVISMGGRIRADSAGPGSGSSFHITLPIWEQEATAA